MYGQALVTGTQSPADGVNLINSQMKHWTGYSVESNRMGFNGNVSVHDMSETYMVPVSNITHFRRCSLLYCSLLYWFSPSSLLHLNWSLRCLATAAANAQG